MNKEDILDKKIDEILKSNKRMYICDEMYNSFPSNSGALYIGYGKSYSLQHYYTNQILKQMAEKDGKVKSHIDFKAFLNDEAYKTYKELKKRFNGAIPKNIMDNFLENNPCILKYLREVSSEKQILAIKNDARAILGAKNVCEEAQIIALSSEAMKLNPGDFVKHFLLDKNTSARMLTLLMTKTDSYYHKMIQSHHNYENNAYLAEALLKNIQEAA